MVSIIARSGKSPSSNRSGPSTRDKQPVLAALRDVAMTLGQRVLGLALERRDRLDPGGRRAQMLERAPQHHVAIDSLAPAPGETG
jgi:hypothetical protein